MKDLFHILNNSEKWSRIKNWKTEAKLIPLKWYGKWKTIKINNCVLTNWEHIELSIKKWKKKKRRKKKEKAQTKTM